jgi:hypothetical protein
VSIRGFLVIALCTVGSSAASAQFTTFIPPKNKVEDSIKAAVVAQTKARNDSVTAAALTNMKTWVDSASGVVVPAVPADSMKMSMGGRLVSSDTLLREGTPTFHEGSRAPSTASALPFFALLGGAMMVVGAAMTLAPARRRRRRA